MNGTQFSKKKEDTGSRKKRQREMRKKSPFNINCTNTDVYLDNNRLPAPSQSIISFHFIEKFQNYADRKWTDSIAKHIHTQE